MLLLQQRHQPPPPLAHPAVNEHHLLVLRQHVQLDLEVDVNVSAHDVDAGLVLEGAAQVNVLGDGAGKPLDDGGAVAVVENVEIVNYNNHSPAARAQQAAVAVDLWGS